MMASSHAAAASGSLEGNKQTVTLPIDSTQNNKPVNLIVVVPKSFHALQPIEMIPRLEQVEFVPTGETGNNWSEIITLNKFPGKKIKAGDLTQVLKSSFQKGANVTNVWVDDSAKKNGYDLSLIGMEYTYMGKQEVIGAVYFSGPMDTSGVQYTIRLSDTVSREDAMKKISAFFQKNLQVTQ